MRVEISNVIQVFDYTQELLDWVNEHLTFTNPEYTQRVRLKKWIGNTPKTFTVFSKDDKRLILPYGVLRMIYPYIQNAEIVTKFQTPVKVDYGNVDLKLFDYQETAVNVAIKKNFGIIKSPAGSGKTTMGVGIIQKLQLKTLWLTHTQDLLDQAKTRAEQFFDSSLIGTIEAGQVNISPGVTFALVQTMEHLDLSLYRHTWDLIVVDECHRICRTPKSVGMFYRVLAGLSARHKYGISATVTRHDGLHGVMFAAIGEVIWEVPPESVKDRVMDATVNFVTTEVPFERRMCASDGIIEWDRLIDVLCQSELRNQLIVSNIERSYRNDHYCLILSDRIQHLTILRSLMPQDMQDDCVIITGRTKREDRREYFDQVRQGYIHICMCTFNLAKEGLDVPILDRLFMVTPHQDPSVIIQAVGRVQRVHPHKKDAIVYDYVDNQVPSMLKKYGLRRKIYLKARCTVGNGED